MSNNTNLVIEQALMLRIKNYAERALNGDTTIDVCMAEIGYTVDAYDEYFHIGRGRVSKECGENETDKS